jgi:hypothetical protein
MLSNARLVRTLAQSVLVLAAACAPKGVVVPLQPEIGQATVTAADAPDRAQDATASAPLAFRPELSVALSAPATAPYVPSAAGPASPTIALRVTNTAPAAVNVENARVAFMATRQGVAFPCHDHGAGALHDHEPAWLAPGATVKYERALDCAMPALGRYEVAVFLAFGRERSAPVDRVGAIDLDVVAAGPGAPRPLPGRAEVQAALVGEAVARPLPAYAWKRGDFRVHALLVNTGADPIVVGPFRATLKVASKARAIDCAPDLLETRIDAVTLRPGRPRVFPLAVRCDLESQGDYEIRASLATADAGPFEIGSLHLQVREELDPTRVQDDRTLRQWLH